ncbi:putative transposon protein [Symbiodinium microadriaticum]|uniref:Putative transposon protein n=1 Tax=Symbiodinium microadriaticum TaxID=2951 RepID=A0A1Q9CY48_SYMMI|nr:putative transposon protein [Symbiodinium microadriaticum]
MSDMPARNPLIDRAASDENRAAEPDNGTTVGATGDTAGRAEPSSTAVVQTSEIRREEATAVNPFWSQKAIEETELAAARPAFLETSSGKASSGSTEMRRADDLPPQPEGIPESFGPSGPAVPIGTEGDLQDGSAEMPGLRAGERMVLTEMRNLMEVLINQNKALTAQNSTLQTRVDRLEEERSNSQAWRSAEFAGVPEAFEGEPVLPSEAEIPSYQVNELTGHCLCWEIRQSLELRLVLEEAQKLLKSLRIAALRSGLFRFVLWDSLWTDWDARYLRGRTDGNIRRIREGRWTVGFPAILGSAVKAAMRGQRHLRQKHQHANALTLNLDLIGPWIPGDDHSLPGPAKHILVATLGVPVYQDGKPVLLSQEKERKDEEKEEKESDEIDDGGGIGPLDAGEVVLDDDNPEEEEQEGEEPLSEEEMKNLREQQEEAWKEKMKELREPVKIHNILFAEPLQSKKSGEVLRAVQRVYARITLLNLSVRRAHSDGGREFTNKAYKAWCASRDIHITYSPPSDPRANGRVEGAVGQVKAGIRALLTLKPHVEKRHWPSALRQYVAQRFEQSMKEIGGVPAKRPLVPFGTPVTVQSRNWSRKTPYASRAIDGISLCPAANVSGCTVMLLPPDDEDVDRLKKFLGKSQVLLGHLLSGVEMLGRVKECGDDSFEHDIKPEAWEATPAQPLQTVSVSHQEVLQKIEEWKGAIGDELSNVFDVHSAMKRRDEEYVRVLKESGVEVEILPAKALFHRKGGSGRHKCRVVACGNFSESAREKGRDKKVQCYAGGADSLSLRCHLRAAGYRAVRKGWRTSGSDVRTAFLLAPLRQPGKVTILRPPSVITQAGFSAPGELWEVTGALYGLQSSPAAWATFRDETLPTFEVNINEQITHLEQSKHDPNLWLLRSPTTAELLAILTIYVDDLLLSGTPEASTAIWKAIKEKWKISEPEFADEGQGITFCGFEIRQDDNGLHVGQSKYVQSLLDKYSAVTGVTSTPYAKESEPVCKPQDSLEKLRRAQGLVGELLWLATRTRADLVYGVSRIGQLITRDVDQAIQRAEDMIRYLRTTKHQEVRYGIPGEGHGPGSQLPIERDFNLIEVFADASFCPGSDRSQTGIVLMWGNAPIGWMSMRQPCASFSTAEAELQASLDGMTLAEGLHGLLSELAEAYHVPGKYMLGDLCTKPLLGPRIKELLSMMSVSGGEVRVAQALRAITAASLIDGVASKLMKIQVEIEEEKNQLDEIFDLLKYISAVLVLIGLVALVAWKCWKREAVDAPRIRSVRSLDSEGAISEREAASSSGDPRLEEEPDSQALPQHAEQPAATHRERLVIRPGWTLKAPPILDRSKIPEWGGPEALVHQRLPPGMKSDEWFIDRRRGVLTRFHAVPRTRLYMPSQTGNTYRSAVDDPDRSEAHSGD